MNLTEARALSLWRPWPWAILTQGKDVENRSWSTPFRGALVLHAGRSVSTTAMSRLERRQHGPLPEAARWERALVGLVHLVDVHHARDCRTRCSAWAARGDYHWVLDKPFLFRAPIPALGRQKLFRLTAEQHTAVLAEYAAAREAAA